MSDAKTRHATGRIDVKTYDQKPYDELPDGPSLFEIHVTETFSGDIQGEWFVVPGSGTGELVGLRGKGGFKAKLGQSASIWLDYDFE